MRNPSRRDFLAGGSIGLGALGFGPCLRADAEPTEGSESAHALPADLQDRAGREIEVTEDNIEGPFYRAGAPFRGKVTPPLEPGATLLVRGRVWGFDTKRPLAGAHLDIWQANADGRYDNDDRDNPPRPDVFRYRTRLITDENGTYEYETVHPGRYLNGRQYRPAHIHYRVSKPGYRTLITQLYFEGDPYNGIDPFIKPSLIIPLAEVEVADSAYSRGTFDIVLASGR